MNPNSLQPHPLLSVMPRIEEDTAIINSFRDDIASNGILQPVLIVAGTTTYVDGGRRVAAARTLGLDVPVHEIPANQATEAILSSVMRRRHLNKSQQAYLVYPILEPVIEASKARRLENLRKGESPDKVLNTLSGNSAPTTIAELAASLGFSPSYLKRARKLHVAWETEKFEVMGVDYPVTDADKKWAENALFFGNKSEEKDEEKTTIVSLGNVIAGLGSRVLPLARRGLDGRQSVFSFEKAETGLERYGKLLGKVELFGPGYIDRTRGLLKKNFQDLPEEALEELTYAIRQVRRERKGAA